VADSTLAQVIEGDGVKIPTEPIGSIPRPGYLIEGIAELGTDRDPSLDFLYEQAVRDTLARFEETGSPVVTDGEQRKYHNFRTYPVEGLANISPDGFGTPFKAGTRAGCGG
jgi:5-methyltetrahydropteroyltriglutamate--homocysteine methyltransferase